MKPYDAFRFIQQIVLVKLDWYAKQLVKTKKGDESENHYT